jgi:hypothetical protein
MLRLRFKPVKRPFLCLDDRLRTYALQRFPRSDRSRADALQNVKTWSHATMHARRRRLGSAVLKT